MVLGVACEDNNLLVRVDINGAHELTSSPTGGGPDVMSVDPGLGWLYVASESGDLAVFDIGKPVMRIMRPKLLPSPAPSAPHSM
jgi:hypothetical protein